MTCQKIHWIEFLFKHCQLYMILVTKTQLAIWKEKILWKSIIFSQERGLLVISNFDQQKLYLLTKLCPKQCRQHSISCQKCFIDYFTDYSLRHVADFASAWICNSLLLCDRGYCFIPGKIRMVKLVSVNEDFISAMTLLGKEDEPFAARETLQELACLLYQVKLEVDVTRQVTSCFQRKRIHCHLDFCHLQKMCSIYILNVLNTNSRSAKKH